MPLDVLIVDDHAPFRASLRALLEAGGIRVVAEAADGASAIESAATLRPSLVLLDVQLPDMSGLDVAARIAALPDPAPVILISARAAHDYGPRLRRAPARGFIQKDALDIDGILSMAGHA